MIVDLLIIGGGINGAGIAADAAGRGLSVLLCEKDDLAFATSSATSKLIHGGLRYLEQYNFKLVRAALKEREILMAKAPFLIQPIEFVLPYNKSLRSQYLIRLGLWLYDLLDWKGTLAHAKKLDFQKAFEGNPLRGEYKIGFRYTDCWTDDARLVVLNAIAARDHGAHILTRTQCETLHRDGDYWIAQLQDKLRHQKITVKAKAVVNATGPWVTHFIKDIAQLKTSCNLRLVQGSHIVVPKLYEGRHAYTLQNADGRVVFVMPYRNTLTLIGTTEVPYEGDPNLASITKVETNYLCKTVNRYFESQISSDDIVWTYSGVRPLFVQHEKNSSKLSREFHLDLNAKDNQPPMVSIFGGKMTSYRILSNELLKLLKPYFPKMSPPWTEKAKLPGGHLNGLSFPDFRTSLEKQYDWLPIRIIHRYAKLYGNLCHLFLKDCHALEDLGQHFGAGLYEKEILYLIQNEWAKTIDDILWRRTKLGLHLPPDKVAGLKAYLTQKETE